MTFPKRDPVRLAAIEARVEELRQRIGQPADEFEAALRALWAERFLGVVIADSLEAYDFIRPDDDAPSPASS